MRSRGPRWALLAAFVVAGALHPGDAEAQVLFGQNKVVYDARQWRVYHVGALQVFFYPEEEALARFTLDVARQTYREYADWFDYEFDEPIPLILYGTHHGLKQTHVIPNFVSEGTAGFTEFAKGRIALRGTGSRAELRHLIRHEMVHAFMLAKLATVMTDRGIYDYEGPPLWFIEGLAESVANTEADVQAHMILRDAVINGGLAPLTEMGRIWGSFLMYKEGESVLDFLREQYGDRTPALLLEKWWRGRNLEEVLELELGLDMAGLDRRWRAYLRRRYYPEVQRRHPVEEQARPLDDRTRFADAPATIAATDSTLDLACLSVRGGTVSLHTLHTSWRAGRAGRPRWRRRVEGGRDARFESLPLLRSRLDVLDGRWVAFVAKHGGVDVIYVYDLEEERVVEEHRIDGAVEISSPAFSPDGDRVVFSALNGAGQRDLFVRERASGRTWPLTRDGFADLHPDFHPDGDRVVFASDREDPEGGRLSLYVVDAAGRGEVRRLYDSGGSDTQPRYDARGERVLFVSDLQGTPDLAVLDLHEGVASPRSAVIGGVLAPDWAGAGGIVAAVYQDGRFTLHRFEDRPLPADPRWPNVASGRVPVAEATPAREDESVEVVAEEYEIDLGLDFVQSVVALDPDLPYGSGASLGFTDLLGDHQLFTHLSTATDDFSLEDLNLGVTYSDLSRRWNRHYGLFRIALRPRLNTFFRQQYSEVRTGGFVGLTYPFSKFRRIELTGVFRHLQRDESFQLPGEPGSSWLASAFVSLVHDNTLWTWQGPMRGSRWNLTLGQTFDLQGHGFDRQTVQADVRRYDELARRFVLANRLMWKGTFGSDRQFFYLGGPNDLRGHDYFEFIGDRVFLQSTELRIPLVDRVSLRFAFGPFELPPIRGALFNDVARVDGRLDDTGWIGAFGYSLSMTLVPPLVLRMDVAKAHDFDRVREAKTRWSLSFLF